VNLNEEDLTTIKTSLLGDRHPVLTVRIGESDDAGLQPDLMLAPRSDLEQAALEIRRLLQRNGIIFQASEEAF